MDPVLARKDTGNAEALATIQAVAAKFDPGGAGIVRLLLELNSRQLEAEGGK